MVKKNPTPRFLDDPKVEYIRSQIDTGDSDRVKEALQFLCKLYRLGYRIRPARLVGLEQSIVGLLYTQGKDEKVRRWTLNALAQLGREQQCTQAILHILDVYSDEPQTVAAAIAAIYRICRKPEAILKMEDFDRQMVTLAALQHIDAGKLDLSALPLNVEQAASELLRLALLVVGLNRSPINLLNPRHSNAEMVKALGGHHDNIVSQYSVWAITENEELALRDLGIDIRTIEQQPANVRSWILQLIAMTPEDAQNHLEYVELGMRDPDSEARIGLSHGIKNTYFDGLEPLMLNWYTTEENPDVSSNVLDHLVRQSQNCSSYEAMAIEVYEKAASKSVIRQRLEANAAGMPLYARFRKIDVDGSYDLFRGIINMTKNTINITGGVQGSAVSLGGSAENSGTAISHYSETTIKEIQSELSKAERELHSAKLPGEIKKEALDRVQAAKVEPSPDKIAKAISILQKIESVAKPIAGSWKAIGTIASTIGKLAGLS